MRVFGVWGSRVVGFGGLGGLRSLAVAAWECTVWDYGVECCRVVGFRV